MIRRIMVVLAVIGATRHLAMCQTRLEAPPTIRDLGSNAKDGSVSVACTGRKPYSQLSCKVYHLSVEHQSFEDYQRSRMDLEKYLATNSDAELMDMRRAWCLDSHLPTDFKDYSPGRAASALHPYDQMKAICPCKTRQCVISAMLEQQSHDRDECTIHTDVFSADFIRVGDRKWVSNNGPEGICGVLSVFMLEREPKYDNLWTYTEQYRYLDNDADSLCKLAHNTTATYSWNSENSVRLKCDEFKFQTSPDVK